MTEENILKPGERLDDLQLSGYHIIQDPQRFCFGVDAVLLTDFAKVKPGERLLDLGTGTGVIPILQSFSSSRPWHLITFPRRKSIYGFK